MQRRLEFLGVPRRGVVVEQFLQRRAAKTGSDQSGDSHGNGTAGQQDDAGHGQRRNVFDLVGKTSRQQFRLPPRGGTPRRQRIVRGQHRKIGRVEPGSEQVRNGAVEVLAVGKRGDRLANDRKRRRTLGHADPLFSARAFRMLPSNTRKRRPSPMNEYSPPAPSPVMAQYLEIKEANPGCLLFFRMGDFFELFFDDAVAAAQALDIALTKRGRHEGADIPMCGVPVHTAETYLARLIRGGFKVAICDQIEDPAEARRRGGKGPVRRAVTRVVTAGTLTEEGLLDARRHNYLAGIAEAGGELGLAWLDLSTGAFALAPTSETALGGDLARLMPGEIVLPERLLARPALFELFSEWKSALTPLANPRFDSDAARRRLENFYGVKALDGFGQF